MAKDTLLESLRSKLNHEHRIQFDKIVTLFGVETDNESVPVAVAMH